MKEILKVYKDENDIIHYDMSEEISILELKEVIASLELKVNEYNIFINNKIIEDIVKLHQTNNILFKKLDKLTDGLTTSLEGLSLILKNINKTEI